MNNLGGTDPENPPKPGSINPCNRIAWFFLSTFKIRICSHITTAYI